MQAHAMLHKLNYLNICMTLQNVCVSMCVFNLCLCSSSIFICATNIQHIVIPQATISA